jgi:O-antigen/teichoic acid export membrane protein
VIDTSIRLPGASAGSSLLLREVAQHAALVFASTLAVQATTFVILASAALILPTEGFARLSLIVAATMLANGLFEFGLNLTSTKMYGDTRDEGFLRTAFLIRLLCVPLGCLLGLAVAVTWGATDIGLGIGLGAALNLWNGIRASDQARQDYRSFVAASLSFAALRGLAGLGTLCATRDPVLTAVAIYALPIAGAAFSTSARYAVEAFTEPRRPVRDMFWYGTHVYLTAMAFIAIPYVPQFVVASRLDAIAVGTYGLILTFTGPISMLVYSLRSVLLPKMLEDGSWFEDMMWSRHGFLAIAAFWAALMASGALLGYGLEIFYAHKFPEIRSTFIMFFIGVSATAMIGLYSLSVHTLGMPQVSAVIGVAKFAVLLVLLAFTGSTLSEVIVLTAIVMVAGEIVLVALLGARRYGLVL